MISLSRTCLCWLCVLLASLAQPSRAEFRIVRPILGVPGFAEPGGTIESELLAPAGLADDEWQASLHNDLRDWTCTVELTEHGSYVENGTLTGYRLTIRTPGDTPPELFELVVSHPAGGSTTNAHCVKVVQDFEQDFYILHFADPQGWKQSAQYETGESLRDRRYGSTDQLYWASPAFNIINPRFMFNTGDELENGDQANEGLSAEERYRRYIQAMRTLDVPLLITRGNNDRGSYSFWKANIGVPTFSIRMGSFYACMNDYNANTYRAWLESDYAASFLEPGITFRLLGQHYHDNANAYNPPVGKYPDLMLVGHLHSWSVEQTTPYYRLRSGPAHYYSEAGILEFKNVAGNWTCPGAALHGINNKIRPYGSWGTVTNVTRTFLLPNDGSPHTNTVTVDNLINYNFWDGRARFLMRRISGGYTVGGGVKLAEYDYNAGSNVAVVVRIDIAPSAATVVSIMPADADRDGMDDTWERQYFGSTTNSAGQPDEDWDHDGSSDGDEHAADTNPTNALSFLGISALSSGSNGVNIAWHGGTGAWQYLDWLTSLTSTGETWSTVLTNSPPTAIATNFLHRGIISDTMFYRVRAHR